MHDMDHFTSPRIGAREGRHEAEFGWTGGERISVLSPSYARDVPEASTIR
jgi:hypothetical protein